MTNILDDEELAPPDRPDFRRVGKHRVPFVVGPEGKRVRYGRPSNAGKILDDESNLTAWKLRTAIVGAAQSPEIMAKVSVLDPQQDKGTIQDWVEECIKVGKGKERAIKGEAVHSMFDHLDKEDGWTPAPQWEALCASYIETRDQWGLIPEDIEVHCINDEFRMAGTIDRRYRTTKVLVAPDGTTIPIGSRIAADTKTGAALEYASGSYACQLASYAASVRYNVLTDEREPFNPPTYQDWGLVVHADSGGTKVEMYWVDLNAGREGLQLVRKVKGWRQRSDLLTLGSEPAVNVPIQAPVGLSQPPRTASLANHTRGRVRAILGHSVAAGKMLQREWPEGIPGLKSEGHTWEQLQAIIEVVERVEDLFALPFYQPWVDPDEPPPKERHPSNIKPVIEKLDAHPRSGVLALWILKAREGGINYEIDPIPISQALIRFASINTQGWKEEPASIDEQLSIMLEGSLRAMGYERGLLDLGNIKPGHVERIKNTAESIDAGTAMLLYREDGKCVLRTNIVRGTSESDKG